jgi:beta-glucosidase
VRRFRRGGVVTSFGGGQAREGAGGAIATRVGSLGEGRRPGGVAGATDDARGEGRSRHRRAEQRLWLYNNPIPRLGIPAFQSADAALGVRIGDPNVNNQKATALPSTLSLASSWDADAAFAWGDLLGDEAHRTNHNGMLAPAIDIARTPFGARTFEGLGEDPMLTGELGTQMVLGIQDHDVAATIKHYNANNQENNRDTVNVTVGERALREIYTRPFEDFVRRGKAASVMCAFNYVNGHQECENRQTLIEILKQDLGFRGWVMSDYGATLSTVASANNGLDQEQPGGVQWGPNLLNAVQSGSVHVATLDDKVRRILRAMIGLGLFETEPTVAPLPVQEHGRLARQFATDGTVLLKNSGNALPLNASRLRSIAVIGADADNGLTRGGGSSLVTPTYTVSPLEAIRNRASGATVRYAQGTDPVGAGAILPGPPPVPSSVLRPTGGGAGERGLRGTYWTNTSFSGTPRLVRTDPTAEIALGFYNFFDAGSPKLPVTPADLNNRASIRWTGTMSPPKTGDYVLSLTSAGSSKLYVDGQLVIDNPGTAVRAADLTTRTATVQFTAGQAREIRIDYAADAEKQANFLHGSQIRFGWVPPRGTVIESIAAAVDVARRSDVAVVIARNYSAEGWLDQPQLDLPNDQTALINAVAAVNRRTIVVLMTSNAVQTSDFEGQVPAILEAWFAGQEQGNAIADVLFGDANPSGKLPISFPRNEAETPISTPQQYPGVDGQVQYSEGVFVGYRGYDQQGIVPQYPFGFGLSYTTFAYSDLSVRGGSVQTRPARVTFKIRNTGPRSGTEVAQVYVGRLPTSVPTPPKQLAGWARATLDAGDREKVTVELDTRSLSYWSARLHRWITPSGDVPVYVGSSSRDNRLVGTINVRSHDNENDPALSPDGWYNVVNVASQSCVDARDWGTVNGTPVQQWTCPAPQANAQWQFVSSSGGFFRVVNRNAPDKGWDVAGASNANGARIQLWADNGGANQQWRAVANGEGMWRLVNRQSGKCLDVTDGSTANGVQLQQWECNANPAQRFRIVEQP